MIVAVDAVGAKHSGAATVLRALLDAALELDWIGQVAVFCSPRGMRDFQLPQSPRLVELEVPSADSGGLGRVMWHRVGLPAAVGRHRAAALLCLSGGGEAPRSVPTVTFIQQSLPFSDEALRTLPLVTRARMAVIKQMMRRSCDRAAAVVVQTATMKESVTAAFALDPTKVHVVEPGPSLPPGGVDGAPAAMSSVPADRRILYVGNASSYKNLGVLAPALASIRLRFPDATLFATLPVGHPLRREPGVVAVGTLGPDELAAYYRAASVLVMPSLVETVGLPMLEAASVATAVVAADRPYARDVCGDTALFFDPLRPDSLALAIGRLLGDTALRTNFGQRGRERALARSAAHPYHQMFQILRGLAKA
jgi:glycosyltransferase involved in cell wall biosynthesis